MAKLFREQHEKAAVLAFIQNLQAASDSQRAGIIGDMVVNTDLSVAVCRNVIFFFFI